MEKDNIKTPEELVSIILNLLDLDLKKNLSYNYHVDLMDNIQYEDGSGYHHKVYCKFTPYRAKNDLLKPLILTNWRALTDKEENLMEKYVEPVWSAMNSWISNKSIKISKVYLPNGLRITLEYIK